MRTRVSSSGKHLSSIALPTYETINFTIKAVDRFYVEGVDYFLFNIRLHKMNQYAKFTINAFFVRSELISRSFIPVSEEKLPLLITEGLSFPRNPRIFALGRDMGRTVSFIQKQDGAWVEGRVPSLPGQFSRLEDLFMAYLLKVPE